MAYDKQLKQEIIRLALEKPDRTAYCLYAHKMGATIAAECIVGHAMSNLGLMTLDELRFFEWNNLKLEYEDEEGNIQSYDGWLFSELATYYKQTKGENLVDNPYSISEISNIQKRQGDGESWISAVSKTYGEVDARALEESGIAGQFVDIQATHHT